MTNFDDTDWELPSSEVEEFSTRRSKYCITIAVLNEGDRISRQLERMRGISRDVDVVVCDGGSVDGCTASELMMALGVRTVIRKTGPGRMSAQMRLAFAYAIREGYEGIVHVDGNNKDGVEAIPRYLALLDEGWDCVLGSRFLRGGDKSNMPLGRYVAVRLLHAPLISIAARRWMTDTTNSFRGFSRRFLLDPRVQPFRDVFDAYNLPYYLAVSASRLGYRVTEIPVSRVYPPDGSVPTKIGGSRAKLGIMGEVLGILTGRYNPR